MTYTAESVKAHVDGNRGALFASYAAGRPSTWKCDQRTQDFICIDNWLGGELNRIGVDDHGRRMQQHAFGRHIRSNEDMFAAAARLMNDALAGAIDRERRPHRRWG